MKRGATGNRLNAMPRKDRSQNTRECREYISRKADANINSSFELFHGKGDRLVVSAGKRIKGKYCWQPEKKVWRQRRRGMVGGYEKSVEVMGRSLVSRRQFRSQREILALEKKEKRGTILLRWEKKRSFCFQPTIVSLSQAPDMSCTQFNRTVGHTCVHMCVGVRV